jgi:hypothetical protein
LRRAPERMQPGRGAGIECTRKMLRVRGLYRGVAFDANGEKPTVLGDDRESYAAIGCHVVAPVLGRLMAMY